MSNDTKCIVMSWCKYHDLHTCISCQDMSSEWHVGIMTHISLSHWEVNDYDQPGCLFISQSFQDRCLGCVSQSPNLLHNEIISFDAQTKMELVISELFWLTRLEWLDHLRGNEKKGCWSHLKKHVPSMAFYYNQTTILIEWKVLCMNIIRLRNGVDPWQRK